MKLSRRDFIHGGCAIAAVTLVPHPVEAWIHGHGSNPFLNPLLSQRNVVNLNPPRDFTYAYINHLTPGDNTVSPFGLTFLSGLTWTQSIDQNGWPNVTSASGQNFGGGARFPRSSDFAGPYVVTWDGDGKFAFQSGTWTEASTTTTAVGNANGTTTLSGFSSVIGIAPSFGITGTGVSGGTKVVSVNYATKTVVVSAAVTTGSGITFTFTNSTYTKNANGIWTNTTGVKPYILVSNSGLSNPSLVNYQFQVTGSTAVSVSSMVWSGGLVTVTTASPHGCPLGQSLSLTFFGATPSSINSTFLCTVTGASTYSFALANSPGSITGTLTYVAFLTNASIYRQADEVDGAPISQGGNGYIFRTAYKQNFATLNPAGIRFLNWVDAISSHQYRFENRSLPTKAGLGLNATAGPAYGDTTGVNQYTLAAATGTAGNSQTTPASMVHGEIACCRIGVGGSGVRAKSTPTAITQASPGNVTTSASHGYSNGDLVIFLTANSNNAFIGMVEMNYVVITVANATATTFDLHDINGNPIDTTTFTAFVAAGNKGNAAIYPYMSLQVGSGNDRVAYGANIGSAPAGPAGSTAGLFVATQYYTFYFDKNLAARRTHGTGANWVAGAWLVSGNSSLGSPTFPNGDTPIEYCAAFVTEVNILAKSQGLNNPIHMWLSVPPGALLPGDPDYTTASDWPVNAISAAFNGGYGCMGLSQTSASLILEWSNELWNFGSVTTNYISWLSTVRDATGTANFEDLQGLRSTMMMRDVTANSGFSSRVYKTLGQQGFQGYSAQNQQVTLGHGIYFTDAWNTWGAATPISFHDAINYASYFDPNSTYTNTTTGTGTLTDDAAMYNGTDNSGTLSMTGGTGGVASTTLTITAVAAGTPVVNQPLVGTGITSPATYITAVSGVSPNYTITLNQNATIANGATITAPANSGGNYVGAANQSQAITNFTTNIVTNTGQSMNTYCSTASPSAGLVGQFNTAMAALGKRVIGYEGSTDWAVGIGGVENSYTVTGASNIFLKAVNTSTNFATALVQYFNNCATLSNTGPQAIYLTESQNGSVTDFRWSYFGPDTYSGGVEGAAFLNSATLGALATRNQALSP